MTLVSLMGPVGTADPHDVRQQVDTPVGILVSTSQMTYDLRRLRLNGLLHRIEHTHTYVLTPDGQRLAIFYTKRHDRLLRPLTAADQPQAPPALRQALATIDQHVNDYIARARLKPAP